MVASPLSTFIVVWLALGPPSSRNSVKDLRMGRTSHSRPSQRSPTKRDKASKISSRRTTGVFTRNGAPISNLEGYMEAGGKAFFTVLGEVVQDPREYVKKVRENSIKSAAGRAKSQNPEAKAFSYEVELEDGKHYIGMTTDPSKRMSDHLGGRGAIAIQDRTVIRASFTPHSSIRAAKEAETRQYYEKKSFLGADNVRGAGHTKPF